MLFATICFIDSRQAVPKERVSIHESHSTLSGTDVRTSGEKPPRMIVLFHMRVKLLDGCMMPEFLMAR
jgi:hypothetical protein